ncbi:MAG: protein-L-isoaspartate(D-aspartate) O-methyltransferase, partial [Ferrovum sp.]|jgi:protein-L-isoaspartate(D-aspartate) O-methyltransferase|nr:protein-L-isoaspartate(D-aspartate) O-methyltransferase [Ferrovum sp.]
VEQLAPGGRLIVPVGTHAQHLVLVEKLEEEVRETVLDPVRFVPLLTNLS